MFATKHRKLTPEQLQARARSQIIRQAGTAAVFEHSLCSPTKLSSLASIAKQLGRRGIKGDFVECGVYKGGSAAVIASLLPKDTQIWLYDSFEGLPPAREIDGDYAQTYTGKCLGHLENVQEVLSKTQISPERVTIRQGWFEDTFRKPLPQKIQYLHIDADWFESVLLALETFYPLVVDGGVIVLDDFGHWEGCREAFYEYCEKEKIRPLLERFDNDQAFWFKGRTHNRDGWQHRAL